ncbi:MAG TPA: T9SS type A sorting domain-containing protein, partial [Bacteroidia bacterium]|nr:T9SS type A sorting domain-containing protein [Bacteroidia bacterium]
NGSAYPVPNCTGMGYGIYAYNSSFAVHNSGTATRDNTTNCISYDGAPTGFEYFSFSIYSEESAIAPAIRSKTTIANANISHATNGITIKGGDAHLITKCSVKVDQQRRVDLLGYIGCGTPKGVFLKDVGSFVVDHTVFEAVFSSTGGFLNQNMDLLHVDNGGDKPNRITENTFQTSGTYAQPTAVIGMRFSNNNSNIQPWCNNAFSGTYTTCIWVESGPINLEWQPAGGYNIGNTYAGGLYLNNTAGSGNEISYYEDILFFPPAGKFSPATGPGAWDFVQTFNENPCDDLQCWFWYPYSVKEVDAVEFNLYPNPQNKNGRVTIDFPDEFTGSITIYNLLGSEIHSRNVKYTQREELNTLGLQPGIYMIVFQAKNGARKSGLLSITE